MGGATGTQVRWAVGYFVPQRVRLGILAVTHQARRVEFNYLRSELDLTAGNLSQHLGVLENAGLITIDKGYDGKRPRTWLELTKQGKKHFGTKSPLSRPSSASSRPTIYRSALAR